MNVDTVILSVLNYWPFLAGLALCVGTCWFAKGKTSPEIEKYGQALFVGLLILPLFYDPLWVATLIFCVLAFVYFSKLGNIEGDSSSGGYFGIFFFYLTSSIGILMIHTLYHWIF